jgi:hypothetical protein
VANIRGGQERCWAKLPYETLEFNQSDKLTMALQSIESFMMLPLKNSSATLSGICILILKLAKKDLNYGINNLLVDKVMWWEWFVTFIRTVHYGIGFDFLCQKSSKVQLNPRSSDTS